MEKKIGWIILSGLIIGPIMGSSIILMPPLIHNTAGDWALPAWLIMISVSFLFAFIFSFLTILSPGEAGVANAIEKAFGEDVKFLASIYLIGAVLFGPVPMLVLIEQYFNFYGFNELGFYIGLLAVNLFILLRQISSIGKISLIFSTVTAVILFAGSVITLGSFSLPPSIGDPFEMSNFGYALLLLFWIIVGWEVMGSFSGEVKDPKKTFKKAAIFSALIIALVELSVAAAVQFADLNALGTGIRDTAAIIRPIFGSSSGYILGFLTFGLCTASYLLFVGSTSRLTASMASEKRLPAVFAFKTKNNAPAAALVGFCIFHGIIVAMIYFDLLTMETVLAIADIFFVGNAAIGILAAAKLLKQTYLKVISIVMAIMFSSLLIFFYTSIPVLIIVALAVFGTRKFFKPQLQQG